MELMIILRRRLPMRVRCGLRICGIGVICKSVSTLIPHPLSFSLSILEICADSLLRL